MANTTELNRKFFDQESETYDLKHKETLDEIVKRMRDLRAFLGAPWIEDDEDDDDDDKHSNQDTSAASRQVRFLDYACGTGTLSRAFAPYTTQIVGIDLSGEMVKTYNKRARDQGLTPTEMQAYQGNLCHPVDTNSDSREPPEFSAGTFHNFDVAAVGLGFHHFDDPALAAERLVQRLNKGGVLVVVDFLTHAPAVDQGGDQGGDHGHGHGHGHGHAHGDDDGNGKHGHSSHGHIHDHSHSQEAPSGKLSSVPTVVHHGFSEEQLAKIFTAAGAGGDFAVKKLGDVKFPESKFGKRELIVARGTKI